jgi:nucleotide-binding universal stress UspA family protein
MIRSTRMGIRPDGRDVPLTRSLRHQVTKLTTATETTRNVWRPRGSGLQAGGRRGARVEPAPAPIVVAVDSSSATRTAVSDGIRLARDLDAPVIFVYVRRGPSAVLGEPYYQRRLDAEIAIGKRVLETALAGANRAGVTAGSEELHGNPARRLAEFARIRGARLVVLGSRRRLLGRSVSRALLRSADRPVLVAGRVGAAAA